MSSDLPPPWPGTYGAEARPRMGFFTDTTRLHRLQGLRGGLQGVERRAGRRPLHGQSYDNTGELGANTWRHVAFIEQDRPLRVPAGRRRPATRTAALAHVLGRLQALHHAACLEVCPTGALFRTEFGTVVVQDDVCNGCGYCVPACPYGVIDRREDDGRAFKCTLCYDRLKDGQTPACAQACPTESIQFGPLDDLRERAAGRLDRVHDGGLCRRPAVRRRPRGRGGRRRRVLPAARRPEVYGLPPDPVVTTRDLRADGGRRRRPRRAWWPGRRRRSRAGAVRTRRRRARLRHEPLAARRPLLLRAAGPQAARVEAGDRVVLLRWRSRRRSAVALAARLAGTSRSRGGPAPPRRRPALPALLVADLGRPSRFVNMLRVFKPTSPMSVGSWILTAVRGGLRPRRS